MYRVVYIDQTILFNLLKKLYIKRRGPATQFESAPLYGRETLNPRGYWMYRVVYLIHINLSLVMILTIEEAGRTQCVIDRSPSHS